MWAMSYMLFYECSEATVLGELFM